MRVFHFPHIPKLLNALWCRVHIYCMPACWKTSAALIAAAETGWSGKLACPLLFSGPEEELQESSFVSSSSTYLTCLHNGKESLLLLSRNQCCHSPPSDCSSCFSCHTSPALLECHNFRCSDDLLSREEANHCVITNVHN